jgi:hypothetical protein
MNFYTVLKYVLSVVFIALIALAVMNSPDEQPSQTNVPMQQQPVQPGQSKFNF